MRIAHFNANLVAGQDGVTRVIYRLFRESLAQGHEVIGVTSTLPPPDEQLVPMHRVPSLVIPMHKSYRLALPLHRCFASRLEAFRPDIIHVHSPCTLGYAAMRYAHLMHIPVVATYHTHFPTYPRYYKVARLEEVIWRITQRFYNSMDLTFVPTKPILAELESRAIRRLTYLPNGVDTSLFTPSRRSAEWRKRFGGGERPIVLFVSRLVWEKDLRDLADTYRHLRESGNEFEMVVVGDGHARAEFERMMPGVHFLGYQSGALLAESFASADVFVFPSTTETFGLVTLEAMASGLAPVAVGVGGAAEIIEDGTSGFLTRPHDGGDLAAKVGRLLGDPPLLRQIGGQAYERARYYRWETILSRLFDSYRSVIWEHRKARRHAA